jgi:hypothetical protein
VEEAFEGQGPCMTVEPIMMMVVVVMVKMMDTYQL